MKSKRAQREALASFLAGSKSGTPTPASAGGSVTNSSTLPKSEQRRIPKVHPTGPCDINIQCVFCAKGYVDYILGIQTCPYCGKKMEVVRPDVVRTRREEREDAGFVRRPLFGARGRFFDD